MADAPTTTFGADVPADFDEVAFAAEVRDAVAELQAARSHAADLFGLAWRPGPDEFEAQKRLFESDATALSESIGAFPDPPRDQPFSDHYSTFLGRTEELLADAERVGTELSSNETELMALLVDDDGQHPLGHPALEVIIGDHRARVASWREACFQLQTELAAAMTEPIDCIGLDRTSTLEQAVIIDPELLEAALTCTRGDAMSELPYDHTLYGFQVALPADTSWISSTVTITNNSDRPVQVQTDFRVRYNDAAGDKILEAAWVEQWEPAFHLQPGQTIHRPGYAFDGLTFALPLRGEERSPQSIAAVFDDLAACEIVEKPTAVVSDAAPFIDEEWADSVELIDCSPNQETGRYEALISVTNPTDEPVRADVGFEILSIDGIRLGMGGTDGAIRAGANEIGEGIGSSVLYTIVDPEKAVSCRIVSLEVSS